MREYQKGKDRNGSAKRRKLEFDVVTDQVKRRKEAFMKRLTKRLKKKGDCLCYIGTVDHKGYARLNFGFEGMHVTIHAHRLFLIMKIKKPIPLGYEAGHEECCQHRTCVKHVQLEHYSSNAATNRKAA